MTFVLKPILKAHLLLFLQILDMLLKLEDFFHYKSMEIVVVICIVIYTRKKGEDMGGKGMDGILHRKKAHSTESCQKEYWGGGSFQLIGCFLASTGYVNVMWMLAQWSWMNLESYSPQINHMVNAHRPPVQSCEYGQCQMWLNNTTNPVFRRATSKKSSRKQDNPCISECFAHRHTQITSFPCFPLAGYYSRLLSPDGWSCCNNLFNSVFVTNLESHFFLSWLYVRFISVFQQFHFNLFNDHNNDYALS